MRRSAALVTLLAACAKPPAPHAEPAPAPAEPAPTAAPAPVAPVPLTLDESVPFPRDVATPGPAVAPLLEAIADKLRAHPSARVEIAGHCDDVEMVEVAYARANLVASGLAARGVPRARVRVETYGALRPIAPNTTEEGRAKNRRVDFRILD